MDGVILKTNMIISNSENGDQYRLLHLENEIAVLCKMNTTKLALYYYSVPSILSKIKAQKLLVEEEEKDIFDLSVYDQNVQDKCLMYKRIVDIIEREYGPSFIDLDSKKPKPIVNKIIEEYGISRKTFWKLLTRYLQSGCSDKSLIDQRKFNKNKITTYQNKSGRKPSISTGGKTLSDQDMEIFEKYLKKYMKSEVSTIDAIYSDMLGKEYSKQYKKIDPESGLTMYGESLLPPEQCPTYRQFYYYVTTHSTKQEREEAKQTKRVVRNDKRVYTGSAKNNVRGPGHYVEIDAQEMDIAIVSKEYPDIPVGRPILYVAIDVFTEIILGISVALDNNSIVGLTNCFLNFVEDKEELIEKYCGGSIDFIEGRSMDDIWPSNIRPAVMRYDNGSDFVSNDIKRIAGELNITLKFVSAATGSLKGTVESLFAQIKKELDDQIEKHGLIRKVYGSKHHKKACLNIDDVMAIVINHVLYHNVHLIKKYQKSADMKRNKIKSTPADLWKYGCEKLYNPNKLPSRDETIWHILQPDNKATISRKGIKYCGMRYFNPQDDTLQNLMFIQGDKEAKFPIRIDPRDMGHIYYLQNGKLQTASLNPLDIRYADYYEMSKKQFEELEKLDKQEQAKAEHDSRQEKVNLRKKNKAIIEQASKNSPGYKETKDMRKARKEEKEKISAERSIAERFNIHPENEFPSLEEERESHHIESVQKDHHSLKQAEKGDTKEDIQRKIIENAGVMFEDEDY